MTDSLPSDQHLIERAQSGDRAAFDLLIRKHEKRAYLYAYRLTSDQEEASDIVADAFVRIFNALKNFRGQSAFTTWLYRILTNCYLDHRKKDKSSRQVSLDASAQVGEMEVERQIEDTTQAPGRDLERTERERLMQEGVRQLPEYQQAMLVMYHVDMLSYEEIAEALDLPIGTVKSRLNRARLSLREILMKNEELFQLD